MSRALMVVVILVGVSGLPAAGQEIHATFRAEQHAAVSALLRDNLATLSETCRYIHANPELSLHEEHTAALVAKELTGSGYEVTTGVGGHGVVGVLRNGSGPTVMVRGDMDALPITEESGLEYASKVTAKMPDGSLVGVMHACGHDIHTTSLIGTARLLSAMKDQWRGTMVMVAQPAEEVGVGARAMIADGLFERFPRPDFCISLHVSHKYPAGQVSYTAGWSAANVDSVDITIYGRGGHGARPNTTIDPIVIAAHVVTQLQTVVSRRVNPIEPAVVTVGSIHGGSKHNIIPDEVRLQLTVRSYKDEVRQQVMDGIRQITNGTCTAFGSPRPPDIVIDEDYMRACYNDPALTRAAADLFAIILGPENVIEEPAGMGGEDFGLYARTLGVPGLQFSLGSVSRERYEASLKPGGSSLPSLHSAKYQADLMPSVKYGVETLTMLALSLLEEGGS